MNMLTVMLQAQGGGDLSFILMMVAIFAIMYFFMIRPQNKKQKEIANFRKNLEVGQSIITAGGIYGKIKEIEDNSVVVEIASGVKIKVDKNSIYADAKAQATK
ncbi:preprotein translocase YajC subunit [Bacteroides sp. CAG:530]|jgi:preprotein translocase subunit YajC|nr:preprotein translocase YajC subunit [Bacteroides sp. CAG:530]